MSDELQANPPRLSPFDAIRHVDEQGNEYWNARELSKLLGYRQYTNFTKAILKAKRACEGAGEAVADHFLHVQESIKTGKGALRTFETVHLSRYACYLIVENADPEGKPIVALGQTYFAVQTRRQELADQIAALPEDQRLLIYRSEMAIDNQKLNEAAREAGLISASDFAIFTDHGYMGLYGGLRENDIHQRKRLAPEDHILDYMGSEELGANIFRATQTEAKLRREQVKGKMAANQTHLEIGKIVRKAISEAGGTMPEDLPTPEKSIQQLQRDEQRRLQQGPQLSLFENDEKA